MSSKKEVGFHTIKDQSGKVVALVDQTTVDFLESKAPPPTQDSLDRLLSNVSRIKLEYIRPQAGAPPVEETALDTLELASIESLRRCLRIVEDPKTFGHCMCFGNPHLRFYDGDTLVASIGYHHGRSIRWDAWKADALILEPELLLDWMSSNGVPGPRAEVEEGKRRAAEAMLQQDRWVNAMPACVQPLWAQMRADFGQDKDLQDRILATLVSNVPAVEECARKLLIWFGSGVGPWNGYPVYESIPERLLLRFETPELVAAIDGPNVPESVLRGAARYFCGREFRKIKAGELTLLPMSLRERLIAVVRGTAINENIGHAERVLA